MQYKEINGKRYWPSKNLLLASFGHGNVAERTVPMKERQARFLSTYLLTKEDCSAVTDRLTPPVPNAKDDAPWVRMYRRLTEAA